MPSELDQALADCETLLEQERREGASEAVNAGKDQAAERLSAALSQATNIAAMEPALMARIQSVMAANRFSLKWNHLRMKLAQIGQPKPTVTSPGPRIDLVH